MGNGPSLGHIDLLNDTDGYDTFGMNAAYRYWEKIDWWPTYYSCLDTVVGDSHYEAIKKLVERSAQNGIVRFLVRKNVFDRIPTAHLSRVDCYEDLVASGSLPRLPDITTGSHTLLWAQCLGYQTILLAGVDLDYVERVDHSSVVDGILEITANGKNPNYFFDDYQRPGDRYNIPNPRPNLHKASWVNASHHICFPTVVVNLNKDSAVDVFVKNQAISLSAVGPFVFQSSDSHIEILEKINTLKRVSENVVGLVESEIRSLRERDQWCSALVSNESENPGALVLIYSAELESFKISSSGKVHMELTEQERVIACTPDERLLMEIIVLVSRMSASPVLQRATVMIAVAKERIFNLIVPRRFRQISLYENWLDFFSYYRSFRGAAILTLNGVLAYLISQPDIHIPTFVLSWVILSLLLPLAHRR